MAKNQQSEFSLTEEGNNQKNNNIPIVWLENVRPISFKTAVDPTFQLGALNAIEWGPSLDFVPTILKVICMTSRYDESNFTITPLLRHITGRQVAKPGVGIFANEGVVFSDSEQCTLDSTLTSFCQNVLNHQEIVGQDQLFVVEIQQNYREIIFELAEDFLTHFAGKSVGEPRLLRTRSCEILVAGTYRSCKDRPLPPPIRWSASGQIDGIRGKLRTLYVNVTERKTLQIKFDEERYEEPLRLRTLDKLFYCFEIETEWISTQKSVDRLIRLSDGEKDFWNEI